MVNVPAYTADGQPFKSFGSTETCRLDTCPIQFSIFEYRPSLAANTTFLALFVVGLLVHIVIGIRTKSPGVSVCISIGCALEAIGYIGRLLMWKNPFSYPGFIIQIRAYPIPLCLPSQRNEELRISEEGVAEVYRQYTQVC